LILNIIHSLVIGHNIKNSYWQFNGGNFNIVQLFCPRVFVSERLWVCVSLHDCFREEDRGKGTVCTRLAY